MRELMETNTPSLLVLAGIGWFALAWPALAAASCVPAASLVVS